LTLLSVYFYAKFLLEKTVRFSSRKDNLFKGIVKVFLNYFFELLKDRFSG